ncbi:MAG: VWA domain-containing protein [Terracidiphilus sp.]
MMRNLIRCYAIALVFSALSAAGQGAAATAQAGAQPTTTLHANTDLVVVDVVVSDEKKGPVHHLNASDFNVFEDGKQQTLKVFEEHEVGPPAPLPPAPRLGPGMFTNFSVAPTNGVLNILLFDKLNTPINAQTEVRDQVLKYLKEAPPGTRMAIFSLTTDLKMLQGFTSDPGLLRALVEGKKGSQQASPLMDNAMEGDQPGADDPMMDMAQEMEANDPDGPTIIAELQQFEAETQSFQMQLRQKYTLDALNQLARYMATLPGRKNLIWFSGSFPVTIMPDPDLQNPFGVVASADDEFRETVDMLARSQVAVYPIDARGLMVPPMLSVTQSGSTMNRTPNGFANANAKWFQNTAAEQGTMKQMAEATGGEAFVNTNGLKEAVTKAVEAGSNYYTIAYTPVNRKWNGDYRKIQVKVDKQALTLAYRRGYFADDPDRPLHRNESETALTGTTQYNAMRAAMLHGAPNPTELIFVASVRSSAAETDTTLAEGNQPGKKISGPFQRYTVSFFANPKQVHCTDGSDGAHHCVMEFLTFAYDADGALVNSQINGIGINIPAEKYADAMTHNFGYRQQISVPVKGEYYLRIGMLDRTSGNMGAIEVPVATVAKLPPAGAAAASKPPAK